MRRRKNVLGKIFRFFGLLIYHILKWLFVDSVKTISRAIKYAKNPQEKHKIDRKLDVEKKVDLHSENIKRLERLTYAVYNDPEYSKSDKGKHDLKKLGENVK